MSDKHWHWEFVSYDSINDRGEMVFAVLVEIAGYLSEADARVAAQDVITREHHVLRRVWECRTCRFNQQNTRAMQRIAKAATIDG